ncbi:MAG: FAD-linked oxidase C-terminal domain-containing protein [Candidatus Binatia bacterium]
MHDPLLALLPAGDESLASSSSCGRASAEEFVRFRAGCVKRIVDCGGSINHHHGVGRCSRRG